MDTMQLSQIHLPDDNQAKCNYFNKNVLDVFIPRNKSRKNETSNYCLSFPCSLSNQTETKWLNLKRIYLRVLHTETGSVADIPAENCGQIRKPAINYPCD